jgi:ABC-type transporter Mla maintaining outer membrane lipid asymmetry ATPase subunit MlaF
LLDEPFSGCDRPLVDEMKSLVASLHRELGLTTLIVSHDWRDMEGLVDEIAILDAGRIVMQGDPDRLRAGETPAFVRRFFA